MVKRFYRLGIGNRFFPSPLMALVYKQSLMYYAYKELLMVQADAVFKAIAHPTRREILALLAVSARSVKELTSEFEMSQPAVSQHLRELREADLVASDRVGLEQRYRLTPRPLKYVVEWSERYRTLIDPAGHLWKFVPQGGEQGTKPSRQSDKE
jgi:DNA-binding transcriptional ArsR family regulator